MIDAGVILLILRETAGVKFTSRVALSPIRIIVCLPFKAAYHRKRGEDKRKQTAKYRLILLFNTYDGKRGGKKRKKTAECRPIHSCLIKQPPLPNVPTVGQYCWVKLERVP